MASHQHHHHPTSREGQHGVQQQQQPYHVTPLVPLLSLVHHKYRSPRSLGRGEFGQAFVVLNTETQQHCVLKRLKDRVDIGQCSRGFTIDSHALRASLNEINALASVRHPFIVEFGEAWVDSSDQHLHIAMEYCPGGDLQEYLKKKHPVDEAVVRRWVVQLLLAVEHLHSRRIIHRDIKLANVFLTRDLMAVKLGDFGLSKILKQSDERGATQAGTPFYFSPEVAAGHTHDRKTDVWSLGVVFYILLNNDVPFGGKSFAQIFNAIRTEAPQPWKCGLLYTEELRALVDRMLIKDARTRPTTTELLSTPWMAPYLAQLDFELSPHRLFDTTLNSRGSPSGSHPGSGSQLAVDAESCYVPTTTVPSTTTVTTSTTKPMRMYFRGFTALDNNNDKARRRPLCVNVRPEPNVKGNVLHQIQNGDQITIDLAATVDVGPQPWYRVLVPIEGYCIATLDGQPLFLPCLDQPSPDVVRAPPPAAHPLARPPAVRRALSPTPPATLVPQNRSPRRVSPQPTTPSAFFPLQRRLFDDGPAALPTAVRPRSPVGVAPRTIAGRQAPSPARAVHVGSRVPLAAVSPSRDRSGVALPKQQRSPLRR